VTTTAAPGPAPSAAAAAAPAKADKHAAAPAPTPAPPPSFPGRGQLPPDLIAIPAWAGQEMAPVKVCILCRRSPDPVQGFLPQRRDTLDAKVYLGCLTDALGVLDLLEIWVQSLDGLADAARSRILTHDAVDNAAVDRRWRHVYDVAVADWPAGLLGCGYETRNPPPTFLDVERALPVHPEGWTLCRDEDQLRAAGLPAYAGTLHRYLCRSAGDDDEARFIPLSSDGPRTDATVEYNTVVPPAAKLVPFNPGGGLMLVRPAGDLRLGELADLLSGKRYDGAAHGRSRFRFAPHRALGNPAGGFLFPAAGDAVGPSRLVEAFLLKLQLWTGMVEEVARFTAAAGRPLLNLGPASFAVRLADTAAGLPALWTTAVDLIDAGDAVPIQLPQGDTKHYFCLPGRSVTTCIYQPASVARGTVPGFGQLYLSSATETPAGRVFDGLLTVSDPIRPTARDLLRIRVPVVGRRADLYVKVLPDQNPSPSQLKIRSVPDDRLKPVTGAIEALIGVPLHEVAFEHYPLFSSAADVYSLAVLGVELLLTPPDGSHAERFRDVLVLAGRCREARAGANPPPSLVDRVAAVVAAHPDVLKGLGPQLLVAQPIDPQHALRALTPELWWATVALLLRMLPGHGPDSLLADFGDTVPPPGAAAPTLAGIYDGLLPEMRRLADRARALLFGEWGGNRLIGGILDEVRRTRA
jgi:hypothetical protein